MKQKTNTTLCLFILQVRCNEQILQRHKLPKVIQETADNINHPKPIKETEVLVLKTFPKDDINGELHQTYEEG